MSDKPTHVDRNGVIQRRYAPAGPDDTVPVAEYRAMVDQRDAMRRQVSALTRERDGYKAQFDRTVQRLEAMVSSLEQIEGDVDACDMADDLRLILNQVDDPC